MCESDCIETKEMLADGSSPAHIYTYTFEPNPNWSSYYAVS